MEVCDNNACLCTFVRWLLRSFPVFGHRISAFSEALFVLDLDHCGLQVCFSLQRRYLQKNSLYVSSLACRLVDDRGRNDRSMNNVVMTVDKATGFLEIRRNPPLTISDLAPTPLRMLERCPAIPCVLPVVVIEIDLEVVLRYPLRGLLPLSEFWASRSPTLDETWRCLLEISKTLEECGQYLLHPNDFLLDPEYVYIGSSPSDVGLVCLPLRDGKEHRNAQDEFARLVRFLFDRTSAFPDAMRICETMMRTQAPFAEVRRYCSLRLQSIAVTIPTKAAGQESKLARENPTKLPLPEPADVRGENPKKTWAVAAVSLLVGWWLAIRSETVGYWGLAFAGMSSVVLLVSKLLRIRRKSAPAEGQRTQKSTGSSDQQPL